MPPDLSLHPEKADADVLPQSSSLSVPHNASDDFSMKDSVDSARKLSGVKFFVSDDDISEPSPRVPRLSLTGYPAIEPSESPLPVSDLSGKHAGHVQFHLGSRSSIEGSPLSVSNIKDTEKLNADAAASTSKGYAYFIRM